MPQPMHMDSTPYLALMCCMLAKRVVQSLASVQPKGCPKVMAPPLTFMPIHLIFDTDFADGVKGLGRERLVDLPAADVFCA